MSVKNEKYDFDYFLETVGNEGRYQRRFNVLFNCIYPAIVTAIYYSINISLAVPDHWCKVPGRTPNVSVEEWKLLTIPWKNDSIGNIEFSKCEMYSTNGSRSILGCQYGWEYDTTWFEKTLTSQHDWVCDKSSYVTDAFTFLTIGDVLGSFVFGQLGDTLGRRPIFLFSTLSVLIGRILDLYTSSYWLLMILFLIGNLPSNSVYQAPEVILMEISEPEKTSTIAIINQIFYSLGYGIMPLIFWLVKDWVTFSLIITVPLIAYLFLYTFMIESPRWLLNRGKTDRCIKELVKIAMVNGRKIPKGMFKLLKSLEPEIEKTYGIMSLFSTPRLAKVTIFLLIQGSSHMILYVLMYLNLNNLGGNPFMNYFWQAIGEIPGQLFGKYLCDNIGRKWSRFVSFFVVLSMNIAMVYFVTVFSERY
ncbi:beta-alanine transporter isoform X2 [Harmonia axyridis]|uniref:beta-alanine transporter isoform X2 n=1 Tax=Harmonia axyridis TaxID=115357 RepID=UPI001E2750E2|nr:beta-alanine transporter isoform X2 [Harmonia axyridis]